MVIGTIFSIVAVLKSFLKRKYGFEKSITINYPFDQYHYSDRLLGMPELVLDLKGESICTSCNLCVKICPTKCLVLEGEANFRPTQFSIDLSQCIYCGYCEVICPEKAIVSGQVHLLSAHQEEGLLVEFSEWKSMSKKAEPVSDEA